MEGAMAPLDRERSRSSRLRYKVRVAKPSFEHAVCAMEAALSTPCIADAIEYVRDFSPSESCNNCHPRSVRLAASANHLLSGRPYKNFFRQFVEICGADSQPQKNCY
jgi:hypothetical protein